MEQVLSIITRHLSVAHKENMSIYVLVESYRRVSQEVLSALSSGWAQCPPLLASGKWGDCLYRDLGFLGLWLQSCN